jgi:transcription factor IIIB 90 kDa subunit
MVKKNPKYSKRINYDALAGLLSTPLGQSPAPDDGGKDDDGLIRFDDKDDDDMNIVEEDARNYGVTNLSAKKQRARTEEVGKENVELGDDDAEGEEDEEEMDEGKDDYGGDGGWEEAFEQEA